MAQPPNRGPSQERLPEVADPEIRTAGVPEDPVDVASELSFPASDPPGFWAGTDDEDVDGETDGA